MLEYRQRPVLAALIVCCQLLAFTPAGANGFPKADEVVVRKTDRKLELKRDNEVLKSFDIALGLEPSGHKLREGDSRTPEGRYRLIERNTDSDFFLSILISYPNSADRSRARAAGVSPGGQIMIHGQPNRPKQNEEFYRLTDWTDGCIAVSNSDMVDIWLMTGADTPITILP